jgi:starvation-inducible DNA-binding protein
VKAPGLVPLGSCGIPLIPAREKRKSRRLAPSARLCFGASSIAKTKNFHWHVSGPHFRDYHVMLDEQGDRIFATTDDIAERVRKIGGTTLRSIGQISRLQRILDNDAEYVTPLDMLGELRDDNKQLEAYMREVHEFCEEHDDVATTSLLETWMDEAERRTSFLFEATRHAES